MKSDKEQSGNQIAIIALAVEESPSIVQSEVDNQGMSSGSK